MMENWYWTTRHAIARGAPARFVCPACTPDPRREFCRVPKKDTLHLGDEVVCCECGTQPDPKPEEDSEVRHA